jgi:polysaccharide deacetylase 2 family uncharacterized protein YibQ
VADDLDHPLGLEPDKPASRVPPRVLAGITGALAAIVAVALVWVLVVDDPLGGEPFAVATIGTPTATVAVTDAPKQVAEDPQPARTITVIDGKTGERKNVVVRNIEADETPVGSTSNREVKITERSRHGAIPRVAADGTRPLEVFAAAARDEGKSPRVAIVVGGLGISASATSEAIDKLAPAVTLAFAPYGADLASAVARARGAGHEVLLQLPMEPLDYPANDPGPRALMAALPADQNIDRLHWFLSRFQGYVGVANYMGARFSASEPALLPVLQDVGKRGLLYLDDGSAPQSLASAVAAKAKTPFLRADLVLDRDPGWADIDAQLARLEALARERGTAIATASALPVSLERILRWIAEVEARGIRVVPLSALVEKPKQT